MIISKSGWDLPKCNLTTATQALPPRIFFEQTIDGPQPVLLTRFLHNKIGIFLSESGRCYLNVIDPIFVFDSVGILGLIAWLYFVYRITLNKQWFLIFLFLGMPLFPFFNLLATAIAYGHKIFAIIGLTFLFLKSG